MTEFLPSIKEFFTDLLDFSKTIEWINFIKDTVMDFPLMEWFLILFVVALVVGVAKLVIEII